MLARKTLPHPAIPGSVLLTGALLAALLALAGCAKPTPQRTVDPLPAYPAAGEACPQWAEYPTDRHSNEDSPMLGCSNIMNLRAMAVNPADLERGRTTTPADSQRPIKAIDDFRTGRTRSGTGGAGGMTPAIVMPGNTGGQ